jgi:2-O-methyltransferase
MKLKKYAAIILSIISVQRMLFAQAYDESNIHQLIKSFLPDDAVIVEAGAHYGNDTAILARLFPQGVIHAFEPTPSSFEKLKATVSELKNVCCYQQALSDVTGKATFYIGPSGGGSNSLLPPVLIAHYFTDKISVDCMVLDQWAKRNNVKHVDFMWLDMEGNELIVLKSSPKILKTVKVIYTEINYHEFWKNNAHYYELRNFLEKQGFTELWKAVGVRKTTKPVQSSFDGEYIPVQGNALFVRTSCDELTM